jgi:hypothetical protein
MKTTKQNYKIGNQITYTKYFRFGKSGIETSKIVFIKGHILLLENGDELQYWNI